MQGRTHTGERLTPLSKVAAHPKISYDILLAVRQEHSSLRTVDRVYTTMNSTYSRATKLASSQGGPDTRNRTPQMVTNDSLIGVRLYHTEKVGVPLCDAILRGGKIVTLLKDLINDVKSI
ncbi:hypothetical protein I7I51_07785 [Histoplasma capsulatum]|uniref:Uncharacterized protein n=1 Tax=Ajellomyces capsulatus TaxID=5037 RepID=A0A8A1LX51_AJECA|nr:hypothetical protein I7I51_07785 [Histoplasma capsulatum]